MKRENKKWKDLSTILCDGFISVTDYLPKSENELKGLGSYYFSPKLMVIVGKRKYKATFQTSQKRFYRAGDNHGRDDYGRLYPIFWKYL